jgi:hypothetical protein
MPSNVSQSGRSFVGRHDDLWYFDRLPPTARKALAGAAFNWSAGSVHGPWRRSVPGFKTSTDIAARIAEADARQIAKDRKRLVAAVAAEDWAAIDSDTRAVALHEINCAIVKLRERGGLALIDDGLPGAPANAFQIIRKLINGFPLHRGRGSPTPEFGRSVNTGSQL